MSYFDPQNPGIGGLDELTSAEETFLTAFVGLSHADGDIYYYNSGSIQRLPIGSTDDVLTVAGGLPSWEPGGSSIVAWTRTLIVDQGGLGDYTTIKDAVDYATTQTPTSTTPWQILVMSGKYAENPFSIPAYVTVSGFVPTTWGNFDTVVIDFTSTMTSGTGITMVNNSDLGNLVVKFDGFTATQTGDITLISGANKVTGVFVQGYGFSAYNFIGMSASVSSAYITGCTIEVDNFGAGGGTAITSSSANANLFNNLVRTYVSNHWGIDVTAGSTSLFGGVFDGPSSIKRTAGTVTVTGTSYKTTSGTITFVNNLSVGLDTYGAGWATSQKAAAQKDIYDKIQTITSFTDELAQDAVGNAVGTGLDYDDTTGAISVDLTETTAVVTDPATQARNTIQPTADVTGLTLKKQYTTPTQIEPDNLTTGTLIGWWVGDDFTTGAGTWADHGPNGYDLTGYASGTSTLNGHKTVLFTPNTYFQNASGFTAAQPYVVFAVVKATYSGSASAGGTFVGSGSSPSVALAQYYESENFSPGFTQYAGTAWDPIDKYGTVGLATVVVAKFNGSSSYIRSGGNVDTTGNPGSNSMTGVTLGNGYNYLAGATGAIAEVVIVDSPSDAEIDGIEGYLAEKYGLELASNTQTSDMTQLKNGVGDVFWRVDSNGTIIPKLFSGASSAIDVGVFSDSYPKWKFTPTRIEIGDGTYDVEGQTGYYQKGWELNAPPTTTGSFGFVAKSNYIDQEFQVRPPGNPLFSINPGTMKVVVDTYAGGHVGSVAAGRVALDVRGYASQTANIQNWTNSGGSVLASVDKDGKITSPALISTGVVRLKGYTVATLPATPTQGDTAFVTDATAPTYLTAVTGGGAVVTPVFYDGTNWVAH